jgi:hypothetical protein
MKTEKQLSSNVSITDFLPDIQSFLAKKGIETADKDIVKNFFDGNDYILAVYDAQHQQNNLLVTFYNFTQQEDLMIELNHIFKLETQHTSTYHILRFARQCTDEVLGMLPTFRTYFGNELEVVPSLKPRINSIPTSHMQPIAA